MVAIGDDTIITIDGTDYSFYISSYSDSGGENIYNTRKTMSNNYVRTLIGRSDIEVSFNFRINAADFETLINKTTPFTITVQLGTESTITYTNMLPKSNKMSGQSNDIAIGTMMFSAPAYDKANSKYNKVVA